MPREPTRRLVSSRRSERLGTVLVTGHDDMMPGTEKSALFAGCILIEMLMACRLLEACMECLHVCRVYACLLPACLLFAVVIACWVAWSCMLFGPCMPAARACIMHAHLHRAARSMRVMLPCFMLAWHASECACHVCNACMLCKQTRNTKPL